MTTNDTVSRTVETLLASRGENRTALARGLGHSQGWVTQKLGGQRRWSMDDLDALGRYFGLPPAAFLLGASAVTTHRYTHQRALALAA